MKTIETSTFTTKPGDVAGVVAGLRDLAYMLECNHVGYIEGGMSATAATEVDGTQILVNVRIVAHINT